MSEKPGRDEPVANPKPMKQDGSRTNTFLKYTSLFLLFVQNTIVVLLLRYSRTMEGTRYLTSTAVVVTEIMKFVACFFLVLHGNHWRLMQTLRLLKYEIIEKYDETLKVSIPSFLYTVQNNLIYVALSNLDAATFQVTYQMKIFIIAFFSVSMLGKKISCMQWTAVGLLAVAVALVQWPVENTSANAIVITPTMRLVGVVCVLIACTSSGFSGVFFEKMLKGSDTSVWIRNIQLGFLGFLFALMEVYAKDHKAVAEEGFFQGYNSVVWILVTIQALGGLIVAAVIKYADNILKCFATALAIIISSILSYFVLNDFTPSLPFMTGAFLVILSTFLYSAPTKLTQILPTTVDKDDSKPAAPNS